MGKITPPDMRPGALGEIIPAVKAASEGDDTSFYSIKRPKICATVHQGDFIEYGCSTVPPPINRCEKGPAPHLSKHIVGRGSTAVNNSAGLSENNPAAVAGTPSPLWLIALGLGARILFRVLPHTAVALLAFNLLEIPSRKQLA